MAFDFKIMRSLIYVDLAKEEYRPKMMNWLYRHHIPDSISNFGPYCTKYAFYQAFPTPPQGDRFGARKMQLTEHYWLVDEHLPEMVHRAMNEFMPMDVLRWQGSIPDTDDPANQENAASGDAGRAAGGGEYPPFVFAFVPINWEEDYKGSGRTVEDGPNYRWQFLIQYPDGVSVEEGERWFQEEVVPYFTNCPYVNRFLSSKVTKNYGAPTAQYHRVVELWYEGEEEWFKSAVEGTKKLNKPSWAEQEEFPYLKSNHHIVSIFTGDMATMDAYSQYHGYITMR
ncbi:MAG: acetyl-CoA hydrolase [Eubacterium sp.]|nr:acetyl-CoA hydrolase [Eubacterium sp.]